MTRTARMDFNRKKRQLQVAASWQEMRPSHDKVSKTTRSDVTGGFQGMSTEVITRKSCLKCKAKGHLLENCPVNKESVYSNICFNCGSMEHILKRCTKPRDGNVLPYATCFICNETGHLASKCPQNRNGVYPFGGGCRKCGSNEHKVNDCTALRKPKDTETDSQSASKLKMTSHNLVSADADDFSLAPQNESTKAHEEKSSYSSETNVPLKKQTKSASKPKIVKF